jgi:tRNA (cytidine/uridine-2'-O-)-methyltransferase
MSHDLKIVLVEPEIPQNTGTIGRLCLALGASLHLVEPLGFEITESRLKRAGLDYWQHLNVVYHKSLEAFMEQLPHDAPKAFFSKKAGKTIYEHEFQKGTWLIFGKETAGLPDSLINRYPLDTVRIPMFDARVRSINLSISVGIGAYEAVRQLQSSEMRQ